jgi:hypothetical protein
MAGMKKGEHPLCNNNEEYSISCRHPVPVLMEDFENQAFVIKMSQIGLTRITIRRECIH